MQQSPVTHSKPTMSLKRNANDNLWEDHGSSKKARWNPPSEWSWPEPTPMPEPVRTTSTEIAKVTTSSRRTPSRKTPEHIVTPHSNDVLCGRGGHAIRHHGNIRFRMVVEYNKALYQTCKKERKVFVAQSVVEAIYRQDPPGRFLEHDKKKGIWNVIDKKKAIHKTSQALREGAKELRKKLKEDGKSSHDSSSHDSDTDSRDNGDSESDNDNETQEREPASRRQEPSGSSKNNRDFHSGNSKNTSKENSQAAECAPDSPDFVGSLDWIPDTITQPDGAEVVSDEELETIFLTPPSLLPVRETSMFGLRQQPPLVRRPSLGPVREPPFDRNTSLGAAREPSFTRETTLDKFLDFWNMEDAQQQDDEYSLIAA